MYGHWNEDGISKTEIFIGVMVLFLLIGLSMILNAPIMNQMMKTSKTYGQSLKLTNPDEFQYAIKTNVGDIMAYGVFTGLQPQTFTELTKQYSAVSKTTEKYTMHTRLVCTGSGKSRSCTTQIYYSWDFNGSDVKYSNEYLFLGKRFNINEISVKTPYRIQLDQNSIVEGEVGKIKGNYLYEEDKIFTSTGDKRYYYDFLPIKINATMVLRSFEGKITNPIRPKEKINVVFDRNIQQVIDDSARSDKITNIVYYVVFIVLGMLLYFLVAYKFIFID